MSDQIFPGQFPSEIITEILTRLPAKSVCRFKCVSKTWKSLICDPHFVTSYIAQNSSSSSWIIVDRYITESKEQVTQFNPVQNPNISSLPANYHRLIFEPVTLGWISDRDPPVILASSNGLLLFSIDMLKEHENMLKEHEKNPDHLSLAEMNVFLLVINPITGEWFPLPKPRDRRNKLNSVGFMSRLEDSCNGVVEKFIVVEYRYIGFNSGLLCFSSDRSCWVIKRAYHMPGMDGWRDDGVFEFAGRLFWVDLSRGMITWDDGDPFRSVENGERAQCRLIPLPKGRRKPSNALKLEEKRNIFGTGGYIHYIEMFKKRDYVLKLWRFKDFESGVNEWNLMYNLSRVDVESVLCCGVDKSLPRPCFVHPFDVDIVFFSTEDRIFSYNLRTQKVEADASFTGHKYVIPFVLPCWPTLLPPRLVFFTN